MWNIRPYPTNIAYPQDTYIKNVGEVVNSKNVVGGKNIKVRQTGNGYVVDYNGWPQQQPLVYQGNYSATGSYKLMDVVTVDSQLTYYDINNNPIPFTTSGSSSTSSLSAGTFVCVTYVPAAAASSSIFLSSVVDAFSSAGEDALNYIAQFYRWNEVNNYYPFSPAPVPPQTVTTVSGYDIQTNVCFWQPLGGEGNGGTINFIGEYSPVVQYSTGQIVIISAGSNTGTWVVVASPPVGTAPYVGGGYFVQLPQGQYGAFI